MTQILGFAGKKQSGKNTACNYITGVFMSALGISRNINFTETGEIYVSDIFGNDNDKGVLDLQKLYRDPRWSTQQFLQESLNPYIKIYSLADPLKDICMNVLGLTYEQCYGSDEEKNKETHLQWGKMPEFGEYLYALESVGSVKDVSSMLIRFMTAREVLQYMGTQVFRAIDSNVWINSLFNRIKIDQSELALVCDVRFINEVVGIQKAGGKVIELLTNTKSNETHASETELDNFNSYDAIIHNAKDGISEFNEQIYNVIAPWGYLPEKVK